MTVEPEHAELDPDSPLGKLAAHMREVQDARNVADGAEAIEVINPATGKPTKHLHIHLSAADTMRVMSLPIEQRAALAESILAERAIEKDEKRKLEDARKTKRQERKRLRKHRRKNR